MISRYFSYCRNWKSFGQRSVTSRFDCFGPRASCGLDRSPTIAWRSNLTRQQTPTYVYKASFCQSSMPWISEAGGSWHLEPCREASRTRIAWSIHNLRLLHWTRPRPSLTHGFAMGYQPSFLLQSYSVKTQNGINVNGQSHEVDSSNFNNVIINNNQKSN